MLTDDQVKTAASAPKQYKLSDEAGLFLLVTPQGNKWWRIRYWLNGKEKLLSLGTYPKTSLEAARSHRNLIRQYLAQGIDPSQQRKAAAASARKQKEAQDEQARAARFSLDSLGALSLRLGKTFLMLTPAETAELRGFLDATRNVTPKD